MHTVIANAVAGDPYPIDTLMLFMANMAWNSAMSTGRTREDLRAKDANGDYRIPFIVVSDAFWSETSRSPTRSPDTTTSALRRDQSARSADPSPTRWPTRSAIR